MPLWSLSWPARSGEPLLGIDMGPSQACLLACSRASPLGRIEQCAALPVPADGLQDGRILQFELMAQTLKQLVASAGGGRRIALALPEAAWQQELTLPAGLRPWAWRPWLVAQAEQLAQTSADALVWCTEPLRASPLKLRLTVRSLGAGKTLARLVAKWLRCSGVQEAPLSRHPFADFQLVFI